MRPARSALPPLPTATRTSSRWRAWLLGRVSARPRRGWRGATPSISMPVSIWCWHRAAACAAISSTGASSASPVKHSASTRRDFIRPALRRVGASRMASTRRRAVAFVGAKASAGKHLDVLAAAVARLGAPYVLVAIGAGPAPPPASARVRVLPFLAGIDSLATALASADGFVHAGDQETFGLSVLEALACGTPIVVRDAGGLGEIVDPGCGIAVASAEPAAFAEAIAALFGAQPRCPGAAPLVPAPAKMDWNSVLPGARSPRGLLRVRKLQRRPRLRSTRPRCRPSDERHRTRAGRALRLRRLA